MTNNNTRDAAASPSPEYVVAIGASAGGLDALEKLFANLPGDTGAAFVVIQHLSADHKSMMDSLLSRYTSMPVHMVRNDMRIEPNSVYLIPPGSEMHLHGLHFRLTPKAPRKLSLPIDVFFQSLAQQFQEKSVGIILSGTGSDGTRGAGAINEAGGLLIAQAPEDAQFDGMPRSVIATGLVDAILPIDAIHQRLLSYVSDQTGIIKPSSEVHVQPAYEGVLALLFKAGGINFEEYKPGTISRRIERRLAVRQVADIAEYLDLLKEDPAELLTLRRELLIPVTSFFRDTEAFETLRHQVIDSILASKPPDQGIKVWCAGVSTGEEAYSIAMMFLEAFDRAKRWPSLKVFATDVEQINIDTGSAGVYPESIVAEISPEQLERFFVKRGTHFHVKNELRQCIVFARHNLLSDPPFTKMDLVVCRNVLIYFRSLAQQRVMRRLQYSVQPRGYLFLGSSESLGSLQNDFHVVSSRYKIWQVAREIALPMDFDGRFQHRASGLPPPSHPYKPHSAMHWQVLRDKSVVQQGYETLLQAFTPPPAILIGPSQELVHSYGDVHQFLHIKPGEASLELHRILADPLIPVATALLFKSSRERASTTSDVVYLSSDTAPDQPRKAVRLSAWPVSVANQPEDAQPFTLLVFQVIQQAVSSSSVLPVDVEIATTERLSILQQELAATRASLQATIEELETTNEEMQATNEEMMASNEELQSSNEELQSVNEELNTINAEYQEKIEILNRVNADLENLTRVVTSSAIFVDEKLHLTRFSPDAAQIFKLRDTDIGRPLSDLSHALKYPQLMEDLRATLDRGTMFEKDVPGHDGRTYLVRMLPYRVPSSDIQGLVVNCIDITTVRQASRLQEVLDATHGAVALLNSQGNVLLTNKVWNQGLPVQEPAHSPYGCPPGQNYLEACQHNQYIEQGSWGPKVLQGLLDVLKGHTPSFSLHYTLWMQLRATHFVLHANRLQDPYPGILVQHIEMALPAHDLSDTAPSV